MQTRPDDDQLEDIQWMADTFHTTVSGIYTMRSRGKLPPAIRVGRRLLWRRGDVRQWVADQLEAAG